MWRCVALLGLLPVCVPLLAMAGEVVLVFDHDVAWQAGTTYLLRQSSWHNRQVTMQERVLPAPLTPAQCRPLVDSAMAATFVDDTLCVPLCLEPGEYSLTVAAAQDGLRSLESNVLDVSLTSTSSCQGSKTAPPKNADTTTKALIGAGVVAGATG